MKTFDDIQIEDVHDDAEVERRREEMEVYMAGQEDDLTPMRNMLDREEMVCDLREVLGDLTLTE